MVLMDMKQRMTGLVEKPSVAFFNVQLDNREDFV
jgi:hypothetical protein